MNKQRAAEMIHEREERREDYQENEVEMKLKQRWPVGTCCGTVELCFFMALSEFGLNGSMCFI